MANPKHLKILEQGVKTWNKWREDRPDIKPDLRGADFVWANLKYANLQKAKLQNANLQWGDLQNANLQDAKLNYAELQGANLQNANLQNANLQNANLQWADLQWADLQWADLQEAKLEGAYFQLAKLQRTNFEGANLQDARFGMTLLADIDLSEVKNLDTVDHRAPSSIGIDTIVKSKGNIPEVFLRGCGVPENFIEQIPSIIFGMAPIQFYSCFISYSTKDSSELAKRLRNDLEAKGVRVWLDKKDIQGGKKAHMQFDENIRMHDKFLLIVSEHSMNSSWVKTEIKMAVKSEKETGKKKLFPIKSVDFKDIKKWKLFDSDEGEDLAKRIREYHIPDFSNWDKDNEQYKEGLENLLRDIDIGKQK